MRRTILIGDVHGCSAELSDLLSLVRFGSDDRLVFVGDLVARGPDSLGVLKIVRELGGQAVRGNHEERLLAARVAQRCGGRPPKMSGSHTAVFRAMEEADWAQLEALPLKLDLEEHGVRIVHAGVVPGRSWEEQDPWLLTHIRSIEEDGSPSEGWGRPWGAFYQGPPHIVFGHNAQREPQLHPHATGLDTGCVYGGSLTAMVLPAGSAPQDLSLRRESLVSVPARKQYMNYGRPLPGN